MDRGFTKLGYRKSGSYYMFFFSEVGIYKRKQESKKTRKKELDQESDLEEKKTRKQT